jgi:hypothetical protein
LLSVTKLGGKDDERTSFPMFLARRCTISALSGNEQTKTNETNAFCVFRLLSNVINSKIWRKG